MKSRTARVKPATDENVRPAVVIRRAYDQASKGQRTFLELCSACASFSSRGALPA